MHETTPTLSVTAQVEQAPSFAEKLGTIRRDGAASTSRALLPSKQASTSVEKGGTIRKHEVVSTSSTPHESKVNLSPKLANPVKITSSSKGDESDDASRPPPNSLFVKGGDFLMRTMSK